MQASFSFNFFFMVGDGNFFKLSNRKGKVPDVLIATIEPPTGMLVSGRGCLIQARLCRPKRAESRGDQQAKEISDGILYNANLIVIYRRYVTFLFILVMVKGLPFLEYELHRQLINKLRTKGMNAIFHLKVTKLKTSHYRYATDSSIEDMLVLEHVFMKEFRIDL